MKKIVVLLMLLISTALFAERFVVRTGESLALSINDFFFPMDISVTGSRCSVAAIKNVEKNIWCISIAAWRREDNAPVMYDYYVTVGDAIKLRRSNNPMAECTLVVKSLAWNEAEFDLQ